MGLLWSRLSSEGYYASLDKQMAAIKANVNTLEAGKQRRQQVWSHVRARFVAGFFAVYLVVLSYAAWVMQQPAGTFSAFGHAKRVAPVFLTPAAAWAIFSAADWLRGLADRRADAQMKRLKDKLRKFLADLKDSSRYQRTQALLQKYDPDLAPTPPAGAIKQQGQKNQRVSAGKGKPGSARAAGVVGTAAASAGVALSSALGHMFSSAAEKLIADDPQVVAMLKDAQRRARELEEENEYLRRQLGLAVASGGVKSAADVPFGDHGAFGSPVVAEDGGADAKAEEEEEEEEEEEDTPGGVEDLGQRMEAAAGGEDSAERSPPASGGSGGARRSCRSRR